MSLSGDPFDVDMPHPRRKQAGIQTVAAIHESQRIERTLRPEEADRVIPIPAEQDDPQVSQGQLGTQSGAELTLGNVVIWDRSTHQIRHTFSAAPRFAYALAMTPDGRRLVVGQFPDALLVIEPATGRQVAAFHGQIQTASRVAISDDGRFVACSLGGAQFPNEITVWGVERGGQAARFALNHRAYWIDLTSDGRFLAAACADASVRLFDVDRRVHLANLRGHSMVPVSVAFSTNAQRLFSADAEGAVHLWNVSPWTGSVRAAF